MGGIYKVEDVVMLGSHVVYRLCGETDGRCVYVCVCVCVVYTVCV